jgi:hypothetical protein
MDQTGILYVICLFAGFCAFSAGICMLLAISQHRSRSAFQRELDKLRERVGAFGELPPSAGASGQGLQDDHPNRLVLKERLADPGGIQGQVSEKYRYVARLARSGLGAAELSDILEVSESEAEQMLSLARHSVPS